MVEINPDNISDFLQSLGFTLKDGEENTYFRVYSKLKNYELQIALDANHFNKSKINYGDKIKIGRGTTSNFSQQENFVILECIARLLEKGYDPQSIHLEKDWKLGRKEKGCLDIFILDEKGNPFLMIECKTFGDEFKKEKNKLLNEDGGQLFSYYNQEKKTQYLCLYTSFFENGKNTYDTLIIKITEEIRGSDSQKEAYENWTPQIYENRGIFEADIKPYLIKFSGLRRKDLQPLTKEDGGDIFNRFAEILRRNVVSDKTNAYNKIFNLFLCKIVDEYETIDDEKKLKFQWEEGEENETVMLRLNDLYKKGMKQYLSLSISSVEINELDRQLKSLKSDKDKEKIKDLFIQQKLYTSNEFAFKEVFDKNTFDLNCIVVKEVANLLEKYRIRYETKQQFLGDFFEKLLNTGIKQEVGQFFTPVPIAQFICKSLPIERIIEDKNTEDCTYLLPYCIDYASGSGHFLTEIMSEINFHIETIKPEIIKNGLARKKFEAHKNNFDWAEEYIYGIEKDYRLAKTTKIATFLNGDGDATIICGDGLDNFFKSKDYKNRLHLEENRMDNEEFDIVVANPPYSVSGFTTALKNGKDSFESYDNFTNKSNEIECLFVERTKQLLRDGGVAGIILPTNILEGCGVYTKVRESLLKNFSIKGIVKLGTNTFMATNTSTVILFLKKVKNDKEEIQNLLNKSIENKRDNSIHKIDKPIQKYLSLTYKISFQEYLRFFTNDNLDDQELNKIKVYQRYMEDFSRKAGTKTLSNYVSAIELDKLCYFILTYNKSTVLYTIPPNNLNEEKKILGYTFSNRKGYEGIYIFNLGGKLYNPKSVVDPERVNSYILKNFNDEKFELPKDIKNIYNVSLNELIDFSNPNYEKIISLNKYEKYESNTANNARKAIIKLRRERVIDESRKLLEKYEKAKEIKRIPLKNVLSKPLETGGTPPTRNPEFWNGDINWLMIRDMKDKYVNNTEKTITEKGRQYKNLTIFDKGTILFSIFATIGKVGILNTKTTVNQAICALIPNKEIILPEYLYYALLIERDKIAGKKSHRTQDNINQTKLEEYELPVIKDIKKQQEFVDNVLKLEETIAKSLL